MNNLIRSLIIDHFANRSLCHTIRTGFFGFSADDVSTALGHQDRRQHDLQTGRGLANALVLIAFFMFLMFPVNAWALAVGDRVQANTSLNVRSSPAGSLQGTQPQGTQGKIVNGPVTAALQGTSYVWWQVDWDTGVDGWSIDSGLTKLTAPVNRAPTLTLTSSSGASVATGQVYSITLNAADADGNLKNVDVNWNDGSATPVETKFVTGGQASVTFTRSFSAAKTRVSEILCKCNLGR